MEQSELGAHPNFVYGVIAEIAGRERSAIAHYRIEIRRTSYFKAHGALASLLAKRGRVSEALKHVTQAMRRSPDNRWTSSALNDLALLYSRKGLTEKSIKALKQSIRLNPQDAVPRVNGAIEFLERGDRERGGDWLAEAVRLRKNDRQVDDIVGYLLIAYDFDLRRGIRILEAAIKREPRNARAIADLAVGYMKLGHEPKAKALAKRARRLGPRDREVSRQVALVIGQTRPLQSASRRSVRRTSHGAH